MNCREFTEFLHEYLFGSLPVVEHAELEKHLAECPWCTAYLDSYRTTILLERAAFASEDAPPPADAPEPRLGWQATIEGTAVRVIAADGKLFAVTRQGRIYCFAGEQVEPQITHIALPPALADGPWSQRVAALLPAADANVRLPGRDAGRARG